MTWNSEHHEISMLFCWVGGMPAIHSPAGEGGGGVFARQSTAGVWGGLRLRQIAWKFLLRVIKCRKNYSQQNVMYTGQGNKEQVSQDLKDGFLMFYLLLVDLCLYLGN